MNGWAGEPRATRWADGLPGVPVGESSFVVDTVRGRYRVTVVSFAVVSVSQASLASSGSGAGPQHEERASAGAVRPS